MTCPAIEDQRKLVICLDYVYPVVIQGIFGYRFASFLNQAK